MPTRKDELDWAQRTAALSTGRTSRVQISPRSASAQGSLDNVWAIRPGTGIFSGGNVNGFAKGSLLDRWQPNGRLAGFTPPAKSVDKTRDPSVNERGLTFGNAPGSGMSAPAAYDPSLTGEDYGTDKAASPGGTFKGTPVPGDGSVGNGASKLDNDPFSADGSATEDEFPDVASLFRRYQVYGNGNPDDMLDAFRALMRLSGRA